ncbi:transcription factor HES-7 [Varanus komodoensis]|uniref:transcription factor HES-7 n=1 Tax=Varanus komodoensis TaxID=61221 RepID=UPI001CF7A8E8|nr:transcription factor HES-7 [Varanus komodoensis]
MAGGLRPPGGAGAAQKEGGRRRQKRRGIPSLPAPPAPDPESFSKAGKGVSTPLGVRLRGAAHPIQGSPPNCLSVQMLKPLVEKRRRDHINRSLEELRLLLLQRTHCQTLKNPRVEKAEILEIAVGYLREMNSTKPQGAEFSEDQTLQTCYMMGFRECLLGLAAFIQQAHPSVQVHLLDTLHLYLASKPEPHNQDWTFAGFSPSPSLESPPRTPESFGSPLKTLSEPLRSPDPPCSSAGQLVSQQRDPHESTPKRMLPPVAFWRPWP